MDRHARLTRGRVAAVDSWPRRAGRRDGGAAVVGSEAHVGLHDRPGRLDAEGRLGLLERQRQDHCRGQGLQAFSLNKANLQSMLAAAPAPTSDDELVISLPDPERQVPAVRASSVRRSWRRASPRSIPTSRRTAAAASTTRPRRSMRTSRGSASMPRSARSTGAWYIDPYYAPRTRASTRATTAARSPRTRTQFIERDVSAADLSVDKGYYHAADTVTVNGSGFAENAAITIDDLGSRGAVRDPHGQRDLRRLRLLLRELRRRSRREARRPHRLRDRRRVVGRQRVPGRPRRRSDGRIRRPATSCASTAPPSSPTRATPPTTAARRTSLRPRSRS